MIELESPSFYGEYTLTVRNSVTGEIKQELTCKNRINPKVYEQILFGTQDFQSLTTDYCFIGLDRIDVNNDAEFVFFTPETWENGCTFEEARWREANRESNKARSHYYLLTSKLTPGEKLEWIYERAWTFPNGYPGVIKSVAVGDFRDTTEYVVTDVDYSDGKKYVFPTPDNRYTGRMSVYKVYATFLSKTNIVDESGMLTSITMDEIDELTVTYRVICNYNTFAPDKQITVDVDGKKINATISKVKPNSNFRTNPTNNDGVNSVNPFTLPLRQYGDLVATDRLGFKVNRNTTLYTWNDNKTGYHDIDTHLLNALTFVDRPDPINEPFKFRAKIDYGVDTGNGRIDAIRLKVGYDDVWIKLDEPIIKTNEMEITLTFLIDMGGVNNVT